MWALHVCDLIDFCLRFYCLKMDSLCWIMCLNFRNNFDLNYSIGKLEPVLHAINVLDDVVQTHFLFSRRQWTVIRQNNNNTTRKMSKSAISTHFVTTFVFWICVWNVSEFGHKISTFVSSNVNTSKKNFIMSTNSLSVQNFAFSPIRIILLLFYSTPLEITTTITTISIEARIKVFFLSSHCHYVYVILLCCWYSYCSVLVLPTSVLAHIHTVFPHSNNIGVVAVVLV